MCANIIRTRANTIYMRANAIRTRVNGLYVGDGNGYMRENGAGGRVKRVVGGDRGVGV
jgi:hypothetical protein